jgi:type II secretory pathway pseudopilin PulG
MPRIRRSCYLAIERLVFLYRRPRGELMKGETGTSLIETVVALVLLGIIGVAFLDALTTSTNARAIADEHTSARILAESQMEYIRQQDYAFAYDPPEIPDEYAGYSTQITVDNLRNGNIQKITVTVSHHDKNVTSLESYKANR